MHEELYLLFLLKILFLKSVILNILSVHLTTVTHNACLKFYLNLLYGSLTTECELF